MVHTILQELLKNKGFQVVNCKPKDSIYDCVKAMNEARIGCVLILEEGRIVGIFSERDLLTKVIPEKLDTEHTPVSDIMNRDVICVEPDTTVEEAMTIMTEKRVRHLPVIEDSMLIGLISIGDITKWLSSKHRTQIQEIDDLVRYINGGYSL